MKKTLPAIAIFISATLLAQPEGTSETATEENSAPIHFDLSAAPIPSQGSIITLRSEEEETLSEVRKAEEKIISTLLQQGRIDSIVHYFNSLEDGPSAEEEVR